MAASMQQHSCRIFRCSRLILNRSLYTCSVLHNPDTETELRERKGIVIPNRKHRDSLAILKALSRTVQKDYGAPEYMYLDDPYLTPTSSLNKRTFALSKASGRKAAKFMLKEYPEYFDAITTANPKIEAFCPPEQSYEHNSDDEIALQERIHMRQVSEAWDLYSRLKESGSELSQQTLNSLLDLLSIYNSTEPRETLEPEELWFRREIGQDNNRKIRKTWKTDGLAEQLFDSMTEKNSHSYSSIIRGMVKHYETDKAFHLYHEMLEKNITIDVNMYTALLSVAGLHMDSYDLKWELVEELLKQMDTAGVKPNLQIFNAVLFTLSRMPKYRRSCDLANQMLHEMKACDIEPSLGTWNLILHIFYPFPDSSGDALHDIIKELDGKHFSIQEPEDNFFFSNAMNKACLILRDIELAYKIDDILNTGNNIALLGDASKESSYYSAFFRLVMAVEPLEKVMEYYDRIVPNMWVPNYAAVEEIFQTLELYDGYSYLPSIWSDLVLFNFIRNEDILTSLLKLMARKKQESELQNKFVDIAMGVLERIQEDSQKKFTRIQPMRLNSAMLGSIMSVCLKGEQLDKAWELLTYYKKHSASLGGLLGEDVLKELTEICVETQHVDHSIQCITFMTELGYSKAKELAALVKEKLDLSDFQRQHLDAIV